MLFSHLMSQKCLTASSLTTVPSHTGHCPLSLPVVASSLLLRCSQPPLALLSWAGGRVALQRCGRMEGRKSVREVERTHVCQNSSKTLGEAEKATGSCSRSRWSECVWAKEGGLMGSKVREALLLRESEGEGEGEKFIIHVCEIRIKLNRLLGIILRDFPTWG